MVCIMHALQLHYLFYYILYNIRDFYDLVWAGCQTSIPRTLYDLRLTGPRKNREQTDILYDRKKSESQN